MTSIEFVLNDYVQLRFESHESADAPVLNCYVWPTVNYDERDWKEADLGYADSLRRLTPGLVLSTAEAVGVGLRIELDSGTIQLHPTREEVHVEVALLSGFADRRWMCWRPGEDSFEDLA